MCKSFKLHRKRKTRRETQPDNVPPPIELKQEIEVEEPIVSVLEEIVPDIPKPPIVPDSKRISFFKDEEFGSSSFHNIKKIVFVFEKKEKPAADEVYLFL